MSSPPAAWLVLLIAMVAANLPWLSERFFFFLAPPGGRKRAWMRLLEWAVLLLMVGLTAFGLERKATGQIHVQDWEFYVVGISLFMVFALPGFIYRHELKKHLDRRR